QAVAGPGVRGGMDGDAELFEVVAARHAGGCFADLLDRGQKQADQDGDDGNDYQQFDQRERRSARSGIGASGEQVEPPRKVGDQEVATAGEEDSREVALGLYQGDSENRMTDVNVSEVFNV